MFQNDTTLLLLAEARQLEDQPQRTQPRRPRSRTEPRGWRHLLAHLIVKHHYHPQPALSR